MAAVGRASRWPHGVRNSQGEFFAVDGHVAHEAKDYRREERQATPNNTTNNAAEIDGSVTEDTVGKVVFVDHVVVRRLFEHARK